MSAVFTDSRLLFELSSFSNKNSKIPLNLSRVCKCDHFKAFSCSPNLSVKKSKLIFC